jgi:hypothetical protein
MATCIVNGIHTPGADWERECPVRRAAVRAQRAQNAAAARWTGAQKPPGASPPGNTPAAMLGGPSDAS